VVVAGVVGGLWDLLGPNAHPSSIAGSALENAVEAVSIALGQIGQPDGYRITGKMPNIQGCEIAPDELESKLLEISSQ
jgi:hypothetical protein